MKPDEEKALFAQMQFCPMCGGELDFFGTSRSKYKTCEKQCGLMAVYDLRRNGQWFHGVRLELSTKD